MNIDEICAFCSTQWLEQIEVTKSALQQKMLDIESEKVKYFTFALKILALSPPLHCLERMLQQLHLVFIKIILLKVNVS